MKHAFFSSLVLFLSSTCWAGLGRSIPAYEALPNSCAFALQTKAGTFEEACSGTLVGPRHILTAAHCVENGLEGVRVFCGPKGSEAEIDMTGTEIHPQYDIEKAKTDDSLRQYDLALVRLHKEVPAIALKFARTEKETADLLARSRRCGFFGFSGLLAKPLPQGSLTPGAIEVSPQALGRKDGTFLQLTGQSGRGALVEPGDSGGALACETEQGWTVIGATSARDYNYNSLFAPLFNLPESMWAACSEESSQQAIDEKRQADLRYRTLELEADLKVIKRSFEAMKVPLPSDGLESLKNDKRAMVEALSAGVFRLKTYSLVKISEEDFARSQVEDLYRPRLKKHLNALSIVDLQYNYFRLKSLENGILRGDLLLFGPSDGFGCTGPFFCSEGLLRNVEIQLEDLTYEVRNGGPEF